MYGSLDKKKRNWTFSYLVVIWRKETFCVKWEDIALQKRIVKVEMAEIFGRKLFEE